MGEELHMRDNAKSPCCVSAMLQNDEAEERDELLHGRQSLSNHHPNSGADPKSRSPILYSSVLEYCYSVDYRTLSGSDFRIRPGVWAILTHQYYPAIVKELYLHYHHRDT